MSLGHHSDRSPAAGTHNLTAGQINHIFQSGQFICLFAARYRTLTDMISLKSRFKWTEEGL